MILLENNNGLVHFPPAKKGPKPLLMSFETVTDEDSVCQHADHLEQAGLRFDDYLTRCQQKQTGALFLDFDSLKAKENRPLHRASISKFGHADNTYNCK